MSNRKKIEAEFAKRVFGKKIVTVSYQGDGGNLFPVIELDDGSAILIQRDDECNGAGVPVHFSTNDDRGTGMWEISE